MWDIRVDESRDPVPELRRIFEIAKTDLLPFVQGLPTRENPMGSLSDDVRGDEHAAAARAGGPRRIGANAMTGTIHPTAEPYERPRRPRDIPHLLVPEKRKISHWNDRHEVRVNNWIEPWDFDVPARRGDHLRAVQPGRRSLPNARPRARPTRCATRGPIFTTFTPGLRRRPRLPCGCGSWATCRRRSSTCAPAIDDHRGDRCGPASSQPENFLPVDHRRRPCHHRAGGPGLLPERTPDQQVGLHPLRRAQRRAGHGPRPDQRHADPRHPGIRRSGATAATWSSSASTAS